MKCAAVFVDVCMRSAILRRMPTNGLRSSRVVCAELGAWILVGARPLTPGVPTTRVSAVGALVVPGVVGAFSPEAKDFTSSLVTRPPSPVGVT